MTQKTQPRPYDSGQVLTEIALQLGQYQDLPDILRVVLEGFKNLLGARKALFAICDEDGRIQQAVVEGLSWNGDLDTLPISRSVLRDALQQDDPILLVDALQSSYAVQASIQNHDLRMVVAIPVKTARGLAGILYADSTRRARHKNFSQILDTLKALASLVALVVENARLYAEQRFRARYLSRQAHDLRGHLHGAMLNAVFLAAAMPAQTDDQEEAQRHLSLGLGEMHRLLLNSSSVIEKEETEHLARFNLLPTLRSFTAQTPALAREHHIKLALSAPEELPSVVGWAARLKAVLDNLINNALKFADEGSTITITAAPRSERSPPGITRQTTGDAAFLFQRLRPLRPDLSRGFVQISVHNQGPPIDPALLPRLFEAYVCEGESRRGMRSTGLGLAIVAEAVERMGGRVWVESTETTGTTFHFTLPQQLLKSELL